MNDFQNKGTFAELKKEYETAFRNKQMDLNGWYRGCRLITGSRYEIKVLGDFMRQKFPSLGEELVAHAESQARKDDRVQQMISIAGRDSFRFSEWSMIVSDGCEAQSIHIDVPENNMQFGLILCDGTPGTRVLLKENLGPYTVEDLFATASWSDAPTQLRELVSQDERIKKAVVRILDAYGPLLRPRDELEQNMAGAETCCDGDRNELRCGDLICTSGGIPHAGPACSKFRAVMFAAASPTKQDLYNVDDQYFSHSAMLFMIQAIWDGTSDEKDNNNVSREWMLRKLAKSVLDYDDALIINHDYVSVIFTKFMRQVAELPSTSGSVFARTIASFLKEHGSKTEGELFQYKPPKVYAE